MSIFSILTIIWLIAIARIISQIFVQQKCLTDDDIRNYMLGRLFENDNQYHRVIGHLGNCEKCQQRMHDYKPSDPIEDHLINDEE